MLSLLLLSVLTTAVFADAAADQVSPVLASMLWTSNKGFQLVEGKLTESEDTVGWANFTNAINQTGWSYLEVNTSKLFPDKVQAFAAGYLEGAVTSELLHLHWRNTVVGYCDGKEDICRQTAEFLRKNTDYVRSKLTKFRNDNPYWHQVALFYDQYEGLVHGYNATAGKDREIPDGDIFWMNVFGDLEDLEMVFSNRSNDSYTNDYRGRVLGSGSCSALVKLLPGAKDLFVAHDTWNSYQSMLRILKRYTFGLHWSGLSKKLVPGQSMSFSSYPGLIYSGDDFSLISTGLAVMETTIGNSNPALWPLVKPVGQILEGVRAMVANRMAKDGRQWTKIFAKRNSGTYNNQWMVVDYKLFKAGQQPPSQNLLWVLEQLPGHIHSEDVTAVLKEQTYFPSYNSPYFKDIFNLSGNPALVAKFGDWFSYDKTPRALIFRRDHANVTDVTSMTRLMRYNDYQRDPLSACALCSPPYSAENAISARNDLNPKDGSYPFGALGHRSHGGTDMKLTTAGMFAEGLEFLAVGGPTFDDLPPFVWSQADFAGDTPHYGHPDAWNFEPVRHSWAWK